ncbi:OsmC family peroxiredoxin [Catenulispora rubra]|uniref:OsmC family peroxiredoxin n=1 Tax=Catenulispora rubra TaxID=280293 RepID=UPI00189275A8|nr:OsmC family peroxiredoxin [Catenulispora rubra]
MELTGSAAAHWRGDLATGSGDIDFLSSGAAQAKLRFPLTPGEPEGRTSPEELIASAQASCYTLMLSRVLEMAGTPAESIDTQVSAVIVPGSGFTGIAIQAVARVPGINNGQLQHAAAQAEQQCPVSRALTAIPSTLEVRLATEEA